MSSRRKTPKATAKCTLHPSCSHSLHVKNPYLLQCWSKVYDGLLAAAARHGLQQHLDRGLSDVDHLWLLNHGGRFPLFIHPETMSFKKIYHKNKLENESIVQFVARFNTLPPDSTVARHCMAGPSPRFSIQAETQSNCKTGLRKLWNFLSIIGTNEACDAMLISLIQPPSRDNGQLWPSNIGTFWILSHGDKITSRHDLLLGFMIVFP